jgi:hypothetical protein
MSDIKAPQRIQRKRTKRFKLPPNTVCVTRPGRWGNPFVVGGFFCIGDSDPKYRGAFRFAWTQAADSEIAARTPGRFTLIQDKAHAVAFFERLCATGFYSAKELAVLRGKNLACWCRVGDPCHGDVLLRLANVANLPH